MGTGVKFHPFGDDGNCMDKYSINGIFLLSQSHTLIRPLNKYLHIMLIPRCEMCRLFAFQTMEVHISTSFTVGLCMGQEKPHLPYHLLK